MIEDTAASVEEARKVHDVVRRQNFPPGVDRDFEVRFGDDATGSPAVWIVLKVRDKESIPSRKRMEELVRFTNKVRDDLIQQRLRFWPYVKIKSAA